MPAKCKPDSLLNTALRCIVQNIDLICYGARKGSPELKEFIEESHYENIPETDLPLSELPGSLLRQLIHQLSSQGYCRNHILHAVLRPQLTHVTLSPRVSVYSALRLMQDRTQNLKVLEIPHCQIPDPGYLSAFFKHVPVLEMANLRGTPVDDLALEQIGRCCPRLRVLDVSLTGVSDRGISQLPLALTVLNIRSTAVIPFGVYQFIRTHPNILQIEYENHFEMCRCLQVMGEASGEVGFTSSLKELRFLNCRDRYEPILAAALTAFPHLESLGLRQSDLSRSVLSQLLTASRLLTHLELGNSNFSQYTLYFCEHIVPVLEQVGARLLSLSLEKFKFVDIPSIRDLCPRLQVLKLSRILSFSNMETDRQAGLTGFPHLTELELLNTLGTRVTESLLATLLRSPNLSSVSIQFVPSFTSELVANLSLPQLCQLRLEQCHNITLDMVRTVLVSSTGFPLLQYLALYSCSHIGEEERDTINQIIREENLEVVFKWYSSRMLPLALDLDEAELEDIANRVELL